MTAGCSVGIEVLDFSSRTYNCLIRAGLKTLDDIINFPNDRWAEIKGLGPIGMEDLREAMRNIGYNNFFS